ncbi:MAG: DUF2520 domain-containing protein [Acidobacteria bacterium]|jgi:predicted short-subunit dehydrogenase-like oxidoreductase (DUF2520 family)|nr:MAG: DUF2520 domain-containing protein [Acidobacteriota bacterium]GIU81046.1 MAG: NADP oxidoreductase [Pyrinomonadaceae bacterium]
MKVSFIGVGRLGGALALALSKKGYEIETLVARNPEKAHSIAEKISPKPKVLLPEKFDKLSSSEIIFITTQDSFISSIANSLSSALRSSPVVFHCSGSLTSEESLRILRKNGCSIGSIHPLVSISDPFLGVDRFKDSFFCIEGDEVAVEIARKIVIDLEGKPFSIPTDCKALYHASAVMSAGHLLTVFDIALQMLSACGIEKAKAHKILLPLAKSVIENLESQAPEKALTGTFARADSETLEKHIKALKEKKLDKVLEIYLKLGAFSLTLAESQNPDLKTQIGKMHRIVSDALSSRIE